MVSEEQVALLSRKVSHSGNKGGCCWDPLSLIAKGNSRSTAELQKTRKNNGDRGVF